ncbi:hypothetical protein R5R35_001946 [Gryllus longicercus]|uniref:CHK kinase-like domain-containing protein n=1 Tax=Gryllus longicercus TaxID=2509291 RepID=A0AAN9ZGD2_9ORTH
MPPGSETAVDESPAWLSNDFLAEVLRPEGGAGVGVGVGPHDVSVLSWHVQPAVGKGDNFLSTLYRVRVEYRQAADAPDSAPRAVQLIIKVLPQGDYLQEFIHEARFFAREINAYREALPQMARFAAARLPGGGGPPFSPRCFPTARPDTLVLEDLSTHGFKMADRRNLLDLPHCSLVLRRLARLHATSFAYSAHDRAFLARFEDDIYNDGNREIMRRFLEPQMECLVEVANTWPNFERIAKKIRKTIPRAVDKLISVCRKQDSDWKVLNHGDCWINNIMFKYSEKTGEVADLRFIDFQITRFASPALDITYFMYTSPQSDVRARHMDRLLMEYCDEFRKTVRSLGYAGRVFSLKELRDEMRRVLFFGFTTSVGTLATVLAEPDQVMDLSEMTAEGLSSNVGVNPFTKLQSTAKFRDVFQQLLPYFDQMEIFD